MDTLRATNLSSILTTTTNQLANNDQENSNQKVNDVMKLDKDNVSSLVKVFSELSKHEKILFLINIREFTRGDVREVLGEKCNVGVVCNGTTTPTLPQIKTETNESTETPTSTPQSLRLSRTSNWLQKTFIQDTQVALPKEEVYSLYKHEFIRINEKPISTADFGKLMRQVFPDVKARRLGQRGQSKYCYANIRKRSDVEKPALPNPLPQNELISWAKNKFNIDFGEVGQVVAFLKCEERGNSGAGNRKRRASCGGNLVKQGRKSGATSSTPIAIPTARSASVSVLELSENNKDDPLMLLHDNESLEIGSYFENSNNSSNWPQLRSLLTDNESNSSSSFVSNTLLHQHTSFSGIGNKKKRHSSSVQFEFIKPENCIGGIGGLLHRSQSVPVTEMSFIRGGGSIVGLDEMQSSSSMFDEFGGGSGVVLEREVNNPLFSSAVTGGIVMNGPGSNGSKNSGSNCSSSSSVMFESIAGGGIGDGGAGGGLNGIGVEVSIGNNNNENPNHLLLSNGSGGGSGGGGVSGSDVFFDSVFDLMMSDCQN